MTRTKTPASIATLMTLGGGRGSDQTLALTAPTSPSLLLHVQRYSTTLLQGFKEEDLGNSPSWWADALQWRALGQSQGSVKSFLGCSTGWWVDTTATLLPGKKETARGTTEKINTEP